MEGIQVVLPPDGVSDSEHVHVSVHVNAQVMSPDRARRKASGWLLDQVGNLLHAETPQLVLDQHLVWQFQVALTSPKQGTVGYIGTVRLDAQSGEVVAPDSTRSILHHHAGLFAQRAALRAN